MENEQSSQQSPEKRAAEEREAQAIYDATSAEIDRKKEEVKKKLRQEQAEKDFRRQNRLAGNQSAATSEIMASFPDRAKTSITQSGSESIPVCSKSSSQAMPELSSDSILQSFNPRKERRDTVDVPRPSSDMTSKPAKRPAPTTSVYGDERRPSVTNLPKIAKRTSVASPQSPERSEGDQLTSVGDERPPRWYKEIPTRNTRGKNESTADTMLRSLRGQIEKCQTAARNGVVQQDVLTQIRDKLHKIIFIEVNGELLKARRMLHNEDGLPQLFDPRYSKGVKWPFDIKADAKELYNKWCRRVFETDIFRGILFTVKTAENKKDGQKTTDSIDPKYRGVVSAKYHGNGDLLNGQWWPTQLCALRDGAHGSSQGGISGHSGDGAYSVIMSGGHDYEDEDYGEEVLYCGTDSDNGAVTDFTRLMLESVNNQPVRLIRSHNLASPFAPELGFRYDGLYDVVSYENLDSSTSLRQRHRFRLVRQGGQDPIRGGNRPETRPTLQEKKQFQDHRRFAGKGKA